MGAIMNGIAVYEDFITFDSTFLMFSNYMLPALRMRALMKLPVMSFFTHDSIAVGQDGPSHQPIENLTQLRCIIGNTVFRPCDYKELVAGYQYCLKNYKPVAFALSRQDIPHVDNTSFELALNGGYTLIDCGQKVDVILVATGSEVPLVVSTAKELAKKHKVNVVSMPSLEVFEQQPVSYKQKVLPKDALCVFVEMSNDTKPLKVLPKNTYLYEIESYQFSGNGETVVDKAGFNVKALSKFVENKIKQQI